MNTGNGIPPSEADGSLKEAYKYAWWALLLSSSSLTVVVASLIVFFTYNRGLAVGGLTSFVSSILLAGGSCLLLRKAKRLVRSAEKS